MARILAYPARSTYNIVLTMKALHLFVKKGHVGLRYVFALAILTGIPPGSVSPDNVGLLRFALQIGERVPVRYGAFVIERPKPLFNRVRVVLFRSALFQVIGRLFASHPSMWFTKVCFLGWDKRQSYKTMHVDARLIPTMVQSTIAYLCS